MVITIESLDLIIERRILGENIFELLNDAYQDRTLFEREFSQVVTLVVPFEQLHRVLNYQLDYDHFESNELDQRKLRPQINRINTIQYR